MSCNPVMLIIAAILILTACLLTLHLYSGAKGNYLILKDKYDQQLAVNNLTPGGVYGRTSYCAQQYPGKADGGGGTYQC
ncbi:hypothetical protein [Morganella morganii]|uniref:hypothetical protein n=1 Tax=Morganella morganii TaxID=582 RepID=UPI002024BF53|nr:hypothetical protein [Morganella morganii]